MSIAGGCERAVWSAHELECETVQLFTKNNNQWRTPPLSDEQAAAFRSALAQTAITDPVAHTSYLINLASPDDPLWTKSIDAMTIEVERCQVLGIADLVVHLARTWAQVRKPGWHGSQVLSTRCTGELEERKSRLTWKRLPGKALI